LKEVIVRMIRVPGMRGQVRPIRACILRPVSTRFRVLDALKRLDLAGPVVLTAAVLLALVGARLTLLIPVAFSATAGA
jgi:hypothetical protein